MSLRDETMLLDRIHELLRDPAAGAEAPSLAVVEDTLTAGYARALALEAERWRFEQQVADVARRIGGGDAERDAKELTSLARRIRRTDRRVARLRTALAALKERAAEIRAAQFRAA